MDVAVEAFPIDGGFRISRASKTEAVVVTVVLTRGDSRGRGECVPYAHYGESIDSVVAQIEAVRDQVESVLSQAASSVASLRQRMQTAMAAGAARNAVDCALIDLECKERGEPLRRVVGMEGMMEGNGDGDDGAVLTAFTISLGEPAEMARKAAKYPDRPLLKLKVTGEGDLGRIAAVHGAAPHARIIVDANEAWSKDDYLDLAPQLAALNVVLIEQPFPAKSALEEDLASLPHPVPVCADESARDLASLHRLVSLYDCINIKLDKSGGVTEALRMLAFCQSAKLDVMVGCMVCSSLGVAPAFLLAQHARFVDLDGPLLLAKDRAVAAVYHGAMMQRPSTLLYG